MEWWHNHVTEGRLCTRYLCELGWLSSCHQELSQSSRAIHHIQMNRCLPGACHGRPLSKLRMDQCGYCEGQVWVESKQLTLHWRKMAKRRWSTEKRKATFLSQDWTISHLSSSTLSSQNSSQNWMLLSSLCRKKSIAHETYPRSLTTMELRYESRSFCVGLNPQFVYYAFLQGLMKEWLKAVISVCLAFLANRKVYLLLHLLFFKAKVHLLLKLKTNKQTLCGGACL
jgi:hypothetical protein